jgi:hypothetical protein
MMYIVNVPALNVNIYSCGAHTNIYCEHTRILIHSRYMCPKIILSLSVEVLCLMRQNIASRYNRDA